MTNIHVNIGQVKIARGEKVLTALLGSCVGIAIFHPDKKICGLAHCLLPKARVNSFEITGRFVDKAIPSLLALLKIKPHQYSMSHSVIAGGGNMTMPENTDKKELVGVQNTTVAIDILQSLGIKILHQDIGGCCGRKISILCSSNQYKIEKISRRTAVA